MTNSEQEWEERYQRGVAGWDRNGINPLLHTWVVSTLAPDSNILVPGCGHGYEVIELARMGFDVTGIDIAPTPVARMRRELEIEGLHANVIQMDMFDYIPETPFDAIYEQTSLCTVNPERRQVYEQKLYQWLKPGGSLYALFMQTDAEDGPPFHCDVTAMQELFDASRWEWGEDAAVDSPHPSGRFELGHRLIRR
ncbi:MAG: methyltransferase domain-containing protein [Mariprofundaceae bacterium]|nr:methyltransferase domain-containing protein [Mariprofundaceae bacterium]